MLSLVLVALVGVTPASAVDQPDAEAAATAPFTDVSTKHVFYDHITWMRETGISTGWAGPNGTRIYGPGRPVLREQMAAFLYRLAGSPEFTGPAKSPFTDVSTSHVFYDEIAWLAEAGVSTGWAGPNGTRVFGPGRPVLRDQMAAFLYRIAGEPEFAGPAKSPFTDISTKHVFYDEIAWLADTGISTGWAMSGGTAVYRPAQSVLRDQMAAFMYRLDERGLVPSGADPTGRLAINEEPLPEGIVGLSYTGVLSATGAAGGLTWSATGLPNGLTMGEDGILLGVPKASGKSTATIIVTNSAGAQDTYTADIEVVSAIPEECVSQACSIVKPSDNTLEVPAERIDTVTRDAATDKITTVTLDSAQVAQVGKLLVLAPTDEVPTGATVRINSVQSGPSGTTVAAVSPVLLSEAFPHGVVHATNQINPEAPGQAAAAAAPTPTTTTPAAPSPAPTSTTQPSMSPTAPTPPTGHGPRRPDFGYLGTLNNLAGTGMGDVGLRLKCSEDVEKPDIDMLNVTPRLQPSVYAQWGDPIFGIGDVYFGAGELEKYQVNMDGEIEFKISASMSGKGECTVMSEVKVWIPAGNTGRIILAMVPSVTFEVSGKTEINTSVSLVCGIQYRNFRGEESKNQWCKDDTKPLGLSSDSGVESSLVGEIDTRLTWNDLIGLTGTLDAGLYAYYQPTNKPVAELRAKSSGQLGGCLVCFWKDTPLRANVVDHEYYNAVLAEYDTAPPAADVPKPLDLTDATMHPAEAGTLTERTFFVTGGTKPYTFERTGGAFPPGMTFDPATGKLTGTPTRTGEFQFTVKVTDVRGKTDSTRSFLIVQGETPPQDPNALYATTMDSGSAGNYFVKGDGTVWAWASSYTSAVEAPSGADPARPFPLVGPDDTKQVAAGYEAGYALQHDGTVWTWGHAHRGAMGIGPSEYEISPRAPMKISGLTDIVSITSSDSSVYAVKRDGTVLAWGRNIGRLLGLSESMAENEIIWTPTPIPGLTDIESIETGSTMVYALTNAGRVYAWGSNNYGQLGNTDYQAHRYVPQLIEGLEGVVDLAADLSTGFAVKDNGTVWGWGFNMDDPQTDAFIIQWYGKPTELPYISGVEKMDASDRKIFAVKDDKTVWSWGYTVYNGPLGIGEQRTPSEPVRLNHLTDVIDVFSGDDNGFAITGDGSLWGWGELGPHYVPEGAPNGMVTEPIRLTP